MNNLNSIVVEGVLENEPVFCTTPKGTLTCVFTIISKRYFRNDSKSLEEEVSFFDIEAWSKLAESCRGQGYAGRGVRVVGRLKEKRWTSKSGELNSKVFIVADHIEWRPEWSKEKQLLQDTENTEDIEYPESSE